MHHSTRLFNPASPLLPAYPASGNPTVTGAYPFSRPALPPLAYRNTLPPLYGNTALPLPTYGNPPAWQGYPSTQYVYPSLTTYRPNVEVILIAILVLVALDLVVVRPHKYTAISEH